MVGKKELKNMGFMSSGEHKDRGLYQFMQKEKEAYIIKLLQFGTTLRFQL
ncbi:uncharacterized protein G2W53_042667 [Senna tora]|uniref:Uncharacterized protein n=1 Tax=Senna tora TaxID=362788 RepID=A0A834W2M2_9FABA|nr:uncharacterized protein G2W53_042667 [Senna tora]